MRTLTIALTVFAFACAGEPTEIAANTADVVAHAAQATTTADQAEPAVAEEDAKGECPYAHLHGEEADPAEVAAATAAHGDCPHKKADAEAAADHSDCPHHKAEAAAHADADADAAHDHADHADCDCKKKGAEGAEAAADHSDCPHHKAEAEAATATPDV